MGIRTGLIGLGKMGVSHLAIANSHPQIEVLAVCDSNPALLSILRRNTAFRCYQNPAEMIDAEGLDAVIISTPSRSHAELVRLSLKKNLHIFCEKPFCLDPSEGKALAAEAASRGRIGQVGYHFRFVGTFQKARDIVQSGCLGAIHHIRTEAYGPVVLRARGATWRAQRTEGGGCLYDYASHAVDIVNFIYETPYAVSGTAAQSIFSRYVDDEVYSTLHFRSGATGQLSANWSDESHRKMSTRVTIWGSNGKAVVDRQELQIYVRRPIGTYSEGWHVENITQLTKPVNYYLRGEEYTAQLDHFVRCIDEQEECQSSFATAADTDRVIQLLASDAANRSAPAEAHRREASSDTRTGFFRTLKRHVTSRG